MLTERVLDAAVVSSMPTGKPSVLLLAQVSVPPYCSSRDAWSKVCTRFSAICRSACMRLNTVARCDFPASITSFSTSTWRTKYDICLIMTRCFSDGRPRHRYQKMVSAQLSSLTSLLLFYIVHRLANSLTLSSRSLRFMSVAMVRDVLNWGGVCRGNRTAVVKDPGYIPKLLAVIMETFPW